MTFIIYTPLRCKNTLIVTVECVYTEEGQHWRALYTHCTEGPLFLRVGETHLVCYDRHVSIRDLYNGTCIVIGS